MENSTIESPRVHNTVITPAAMLHHWQEHRGLTRRVIEAFPEKEFFHFSIGGMRPFAVLVQEILDMTGPGMAGIATGKWSSLEEMPHHGHVSAYTSKAAVLQAWDETTGTINRYWQQIPAERFQETDKAFGQYEGSIYSLLLYFIDNEIHHRGQAYVYLRALGIEPPPFWDRA
jgi:uncharacterized damage-inducible protein DinB